MKTDLGKVKNIETPFLKIKGNSLEIQDTTIQLSSISLFSTADVMPEKFPVWSIVLIIAGFVLIKAGAEAEYAALLVLGLLIMATGGLWI